MPFTPLHLGPGLTLTGVFPRVSFIAFAIGQVFVDVEPLVYMLREEWPLHRFLHTYLGAALAGLPVMLAAPLLARWLLPWWNRQLSPGQARWLGSDPHIPWSAAAWGAWLGTMSHVFLDSLVHTDVIPWSPWSDAKGPLELITYPAMTELCLVLAVVGGGIHLARRGRAGSSGGE